MKKSLSMAVCAAALSAVAGAAHADDHLESAAEAFGTDFIDLIDDTFEAGVAANWAINRDLIDASVTVDQVNIAVSTTSSSDNSVIDHQERTWDSSLTLRTEQTTLTTNNIAENTSTETIASVNLGAIETSAVGAYNDGEIRIGQTGSSESSSESIGENVEDGFIADNPISEAAYTENTGYADYSADFYGENYVLSSELSSESAAYGPAGDFFAMNFAYNSSGVITEDCLVGCTSYYEPGLVDGSVSITGNGMSAETIKTSAAGAVNVGVIETGIGGLPGVAD